MQWMAGEAAVQVLELHVREAFPRNRDRKRGLVLGGLQVPEESGVLGEQGLELGKADGGPVLDPGLGEVVLDGVQAAFAHLAKMIGFRPGGYMGRTAYLSCRPGLTRCSYS